MKWIWAIVMAFPVGLVAYGVWQIIKIEKQIRRDINGRSGRNAP